MVSSRTHQIILHAKRGDSIIRRFSKRANCYIRFSKKKIMLRIVVLFSTLLSLPCHLSAQFAPFCTGNTNGFVVDFATYQNELYATGFFTRVCGKITGNVAKWDGTQWVQGAMGGIDEGHALEVIGDALFIATYEFGTDSNYVVRWNGSTLSALGTVYKSNPNPNQSLTSSIYDIIEYQGDVVVCGEFNWVDGKSISGIARWNGLQWDSLGGGLSGSINASPPNLYPHQMAIFEGELIVAGNFLKAGGQTVKGIARWDGQNWQAMGAGFNDAVYGIGVFNGALYAGGSFTASGSTPLGRIAKWNGTAWEHPGFEFEYSIAGVQPFIHTIKPIGDSLFISGGFNRIKLTSGTTLSGSGIVAVNNNLEINTLGGGTPNKEVEAIMPYEDGILVGGGSSTNSGYLGIWKPGTSGIETIFDQHMLAIYPNPATDYLSIRGLEERDYTQIALRNSNGKLCFQAPILSDQTTFFLPKISAGMYFVTLYGSIQNPPIQQKITIHPN